MLIPAPNTGVQLQQRQYQGFDQNNNLEFQMDSQPAIGVPHPSHDAPPFGINGGYGNAAPRQISISNNQLN